MTALSKSPVMILLASLLLGSIACAAPILVPTAVPLPSPSPTWTLLPAGTPSPAPTMTLQTSPTAAETVAPTIPASPTETVFSCPGAPAPRVAVGDTARVTFTDGLPLRIRDTPAVANNNVVTQITEGSIFLITGGPACAPIPDTGTAYVFWEIELQASGLTGWVAEGDETVYYIETVP